MAEQLSMFSQSPESETELDKSQIENALVDNTLIDNGDKQSSDKTEDEYEALDYQLADLMLELNAYKPEGEDAEKQLKTLKANLRNCTLEISKHTREGQIAYALNAKQQELLLLTTVVGEAGEYMPLVIDKGYLYLNRYWQYQQRLADQINQRIQSDTGLSESQLAWAENRLNDYFPESAGNRNSIDKETSSTENTEVNWQKRAVESALKNNFQIISGGPGTGKTTTITRLLLLLIEQHQMALSDEVIEPTDNTEIEKIPSANNADIIELDVSKDETASSLKRWGGVLSDSLNILLAAPTGKAAIRMLDSMREASNALQTHLSLPDAVMKQLPSEANTIHKLLGYKHNSAQFKHNKNKPLNADVVLIDEASMIDIALMSKLVDAVPEHAKLILIGDKDQLSSVETGSVFSDMCMAFDDDETSGASSVDGSVKSPVKSSATTTNTPLITLRKNWRFSEDSDIGQCAIASNLGDSKTLLSIINDSQKTNASLIKPNDLRDAELIKPWFHYFEVLNNLNSSLAEIFAAFNQYRILNALRRGYNGCEIMNTRIETALEKQGLISRRRANNQASSQSSYYHGRPVMITQNSYNKGLFNGDTGLTIVRDGVVKVYFASSSDEQSEDSSSGEVKQNESYKSFSPIRLPAHETTWAMTIHKSQGSEFDHVVLILPPEPMPLLSKQLIYTGITRAKKSVSIVASEEVLVAGVKTEMVRATRIDEELESS